MNIVFYVGIAFYRISISSRRQLILTWGVLYTTLIALRILVSLKHLLSLILLTKPQIGSRPEAALAGILTINHFSIGLRMFLIYI